MKRGKGLSGETLPDLYHGTHVQKILLSVDGGLFTFYLKRETIPISDFKTGINFT